MVPGIICCSDTSAHKNLLYEHILTHEPIYSQSKTNDPGSSNHLSSYYEYKLLIKTQNIYYRVRSIRTSILYKQSIKINSKRKGFWAFGIYWNVLYTLLDWYSKLLSIIGFLDYTAPLVIRTFMEQLKKTDYIYIF